MFGNGQTAVISLGVKRGTKSKRPQSVLVHEIIHPRAFDMLRALVTLLEAQERVRPAISKLQFGSQVMINHMVRRRLYLLLGLRPRRVEARLPQLPLSPLVVSTLR